MRFIPENENAPMRSGKVPKLIYAYAAKSRRSSQESL
jgi:hypothetical protein